MGLEKKVPHQFQERDSKKKSLEENGPRRNQGLLVSNKGVEALADSWHIETSVELCSPGVGYSNWAGERARDERGNPFEEERAWKSMALPVYHRTRGIKRPLGEHPEERRSGQPLVRCLSRCFVIRQIGKCPVKRKEPEPAARSTKFSPPTRPYLMLYVSCFSAGTAPATSLDARQPG